MNENDQGGELPGAPSCVEYDEGEEDEVGATPRIAQASTSLLSAPHAQVAVTSNKQHARCVHKPCPELVTSCNNLLLYRTALLNPVAFVADCWNKLISSRSHQRYKNLISTRL